MHIKFYILSNLHKHACAVIEETETTLTIQKLTIVETFCEFTNDIKEHIVDDGSYEVRTESKNDLSKVFEDVELTKNYWRVFEYLTGKKRKAVAINTCI
jgi:hypothetical protein